MRRLTVVLAVAAASWSELAAPTPVFAQVGCSAGQLIAAINAANATPPQTRAVRQRRQATRATINLTAGCTYLHHSAG
jgi:hypothetical protein